MDDDKIIVKKEIDRFLFKAYVPLDDDKHMLDWTQSCQAKVPVGHGDYRWGKILHDHLFVKNFREKLDELTKSLTEIKELITEKKNTGDGLFKWK